MPTDIDDDLGLMTCMGDWLWWPAWVIDCQSPLPPQKKEKRKTLNWLRFQEGVFVSCQNVFLKTEMHLVLPSQLPVVYPHCPVTPSLSGFAVQCQWTCGRQPRAEYQESWEARAHAGPHSQHPLHSRAPHVLQGEGVLRHTRVLLWGDSGAPLHGEEAKAAPGR